MVYDIFMCHNEFSFLTLRGINFWLLHIVYFWLPHSMKYVFTCVLFLQLAREAVQSKASIPHLVVGNQIITNVSLLIDLNSF